MEAWSLCGDAGMLVVHIDLMYPYAVTVLFGCLNFPPSFLVHSPAKFDAPVNRWSELKCVVVLLSLPLLFCHYLYWNAIFYSIHVLLPGPPGGFLSPSTCQSRGTHFILTHCYFWHLNASNAKIVGRREYNLMDSKMPFAGCFTT